MAYRYRQGGRVECLDIKYRLRVGFVVLFILADRTGWFVQDARNLTHAGLGWSEYHDSGLVGAHSF